jgi:hypothetical protein
MIAATIISSIRVNPACRRSNPLASGYPRSVVTNVSPFFAPLSVTNKTIFIAYPLRESRRPLACRYRDSIQESASHRDCLIAICRPDNKTRPELKRRTNKRDGPTQLHQTSDVIHKIQWTISRQDTRPALPPAGLTSVESMTPFKLLYIDAPLKAGRPISEPNPMPPLAT